MTNKTLEGKLTDKAHSMLKRHDESVEGYGINFSYGDFIYNGSKDKVAFVGNIRFNDSPKGYHSDEYTTFSTVFAARIDPATEEIKDFRECIFSIVNTPKSNLNHFMGYGPGYLSPFRGYKVKAITAEGDIEIESIGATKTEMNPTWNGPLEEVAEVKGYVRIIPGFE